MRLFFVTFLWLLVNVCLSDNPGGLCGIYLLVCGGGGGIGVLVCKAIFVSNSTQVLFYLKLC